MMDDMNAMVVFWKKVMNLGSDGPITDTALQSGHWNGAMVKKVKDKQ